MEHGEDMERKFFEEAQARHRRQKVQALEDELLLMKAKEWALETELEGVRRPFKLYGVEDLETRTIQAVGKRQVLDEAVYQREDELQAYTRGIEKMLNTTSHMLLDIQERMQPVFAWDRRMQQMFERIEDSDDTAVVQGLEEECETREELALKIAQNIEKAEEKSDQLLADLQDLSIRNASIDEEMEQKLLTESQKIQKAWDAEYGKLAKCCDSLALVNSEQRFHLKRGSNIKHIPREYAPMIPECERLDVQGTGLNLDDIEQELKTNSLQMVEAVMEKRKLSEQAAKLWKRKQEELLRAENMLKEDEARLRQLQILRQRRAEQRDELVKIRDGLLQAVHNHQGTTYIEDAPLKLTSPATWRFTSRSPTSVRRTPNVSPITPRRLMGDHSEISRYGSPSPMRRTSERRIRRASLSPAGPRRVAPSSVRTQTPPTTRRKPRALSPDPGTPSKSRLVFPPPRQVAPE
eukprot:Sspe_Gene.81110::Locus_51684_Transcript_1_2_Confidence_0.500_Length_1554::g.81110::m.81110